MRKGKRGQDIGSKTKHRIIDPTIIVKELNRIYRHYSDEELQKQIDELENNCYYGPNFCSRKN